MSFLKKSPWIIHYDGSSCNGCDIETIACLTPLYDVERLGILNVGNPKHADVLLVTGTVNEQNKDAVRVIYEQMPDPKVVVAIGACAICGCVFADCYNVLGGVSKVIPVDVSVPGCAARPEAIIDAIKDSLAILEEKGRELREMNAGTKKIAIELAVLGDAPEILKLQKLAYQHEAEIFTDFTIPPMAQTPGEMKKDFGRRAFLKAVMSGKIIGSVRGYIDKDTCYIERLMVNPIYQHHGVGRKLVENIERHFTRAKKFEVHTFDKSRRNIVFFQGLGFKIYKREKTEDGKEKVYMEKR